METITLTNQTDLTGEVFVDWSVDAKNGVVAARATLSGVDRKDVQANGYAFTHPDDEFDESVGVLLAAGRALEDLSRTIIRTANKKVNEKDAFRRAQKKASDRAIEARKSKTEDFKLKLLELALAQSTEKNVPAVSLKVGDRVILDSPVINPSGPLEAIILDIDKTRSYPYHIEITSGIRQSERLPVEESEISRGGFSTRKDLPA